jgi:hypothetical protein
MTRFKSGTPVEGAEYGNYTIEQLTALEDMKDHSFLYGIAKSKYVNKALLPDGTLLDDASALTGNITTALENAMKQAPTPANLQAALNLATKSDEINEHIAQERFLFIVNEDASRIIYFQCAVDHNPDLPKKVKTKADKDEKSRQTDRIALVLEDSHKAAQVRAAAAPKSEE